MTHQSIFLQNISLSFAHKVCFEGFTTEILPGSHIAIVGRNGSGKSSLLKMLQGQMEPSSGKIQVPAAVVVGYVPQIIEGFSTLSGGQRLNQAFTEALSCDPNVLLLDEPTNHLDLNNRRSFLRMLHKYTGTIIVVSHDLELLRLMDTFWHIDHGTIEVFCGNYEDYRHEKHQKRAAIEQEIEVLHRKKKALHEDLMQEQYRASKSRKKGEKLAGQKKWPTIVRKGKALEAQETSGRKKAILEQKKESLLSDLADLRLPELILPKFTLSAEQGSDRTLVSIREASVGYAGQPAVLQQCYVSVSSRARIVIMGDNGSGKSTLIRGILQDRAVCKTGEWHLPQRESIGYLDQHYNTLNPTLSVYDTIAELVPEWTRIMIRQHLMDFLFRKNEEVNALVSQLSGGEKVRLCLAQIAAKTPRLLLLDEITNNLDLETREHVIQVLQAYPGAMIVISHDLDFLKAIGITGGYQIVEGRVETITL